MSAAKKDASVRRRHNVASTAATSKHLSTAHALRSTTECQSE